MNSFVGPRHVAVLMVALFVCVILVSSSNELSIRLRLNAALLRINQALTREMVYELQSFDPLEHLFTPTEPLSACEAASGEMRLIRNLNLESKSRAGAKVGGLLLIRCGYADQAGQLLELVKADGYSRTLLAIAYGQQGNTEFAWENLRTVPRSAEALMRAGVRSLSRGGGIDVGLRLFDWSRFLDSQVSADKAPMYLALAEVYTRRNEFDVAIYYLKLLTSVTPSDPHPFVRLGAIYVYQKKPFEAIGALSRAADLGGREDKQFPGILGQAYEMIGQWDSAESEYREWLRLVPEDFRTHLRMARVMCEQGKFSDALVHLNVSLQSGDTVVVPEAEALKRYIERGECR